MHCYVAGSIPTVTPRYCTEKNRKMLFGAPKKTEKNNKIKEFVYRPGKRESLISLLSQKRN
jgi:hypothetical protein